MKSLKLSILSAGLIVTFAAQADDLARNAPESSAMARAEHSISSFIAACLKQDTQRLESFATDDMRIEYALEQPGTYYAVDSISAAHECPLGTAQLSGLRIYETADANVVFVQYELLESLTSAARPQLALVELRGEEIARFVNFAEPMKVAISAKASDAMQGPAVIARQN